MPQVASETTTHALKPSLPNPARARQASERAHGSHFESLLDDGAQGATERPEPAQPPAKLTTKPTTKPTTKSKDSKPAKTDERASTADAGKPAETNPTASDGKAVSGDKASANAKTCKQAAAGDGSKPAGDGKMSVSDGKPADGVTPADAAATIPANPIQTITSADGVTPADAAATIPTNSIQTIMPADAVATALAPAPALAAVPNPVPQAAPGSAPQAALDSIPQAGPAAADHPAIVATQTAAIGAAQAPKAKPADLAALQAVTGKSADDSKSPANAAPELNGDGKPQPAAGDSVNETASHPHDDVAANAQRAASAQTPPAINADARPDTHAVAPNAPGDAAPPLVLTAPSHSASPSPANPAAAAPQLALPAAAVPLAGVAIEIAGKALAGKNRFEIRLDPPELGRIEVRLDVDRDGNVTSRLVADRADTLDLLRRDAAGLERALQDAGLKTADNGMQFSLRDFSMGREQGNAPTPGAAQLVVNDDALAASDASQRNTSRLAGLRGGIDIRV